MKSYTDLSQSKKLAEILSLESADMEYIFLKKDNVPVGKVPFVKDDSEVENSAYSHVYDRIPCWSLAALLGVLPSATLDTSDDHYCRVRCQQRCTEWYDNPIDAAFEIIIKLHELNLL